jgi:AraC-like DNA-binding protein
MGVQSDTPNSDLGSILHTRHALPSSLVRALAWLHSRLDEPIQLDTLAAVAGVRPRTLEAHFRRYLETTPLGWVRRMRLARARQQLLAARNDGSVTGIAVANGFTELGRFAAQYRRQFGELPSQTLRAARCKLPGRTGEPVDEALRLSWRALASAFMVAPEPCSAALVDAERAQELAPYQALPKVIAAWCWSQRAAHNFSSTPQLDRASALRLAANAARLAPDDALTLSLCSGALTLTRRLADADRLIERALALDPWSPWAWVRRGWLSAYMGDDGGALRELQITLRLMPFEPLRHLLFIGSVVCISTPRATNAPCAGLRTGSRLGRNRSGPSASSSPPRRMPGQGVRPGVMRASSCARMRT